MTARSGLGRPETQFVRTARGAVAYQVFGEGNKDIVFITHWVSNVDAYWDEPSAVRYLDRLGELGRVILVDKLCSGVSDMHVSGHIPPVEETMDDIRDVMVAVGSEKAVLIGDAEGGMLAMVLAATFPDEFPILVLVNTYPRLRRGEGYRIGAPAETVEKIKSLYIEQHGTTGDALYLTAPSAADDVRFKNWFRRFQRSAQSQRIAKEALDWIADTDVTAVLPSIQADTLVVHKRDARYHRLEYGQYIADQIEGARLEIVEGGDTWPFHAGEFGPTLDHIEQFLLGERRHVSTERMLATVLFTDIVGSTAIAAQMGDEKWLDLRTAHDQIVRASLARYRGEEVALTGDGSVATFDGPQRAILCAQAINDQVHDLGVSMRAGIHTGEIEVREGEIGGIAVHIASRVMGAAESGGILVSSTVKDLVVGSTLQFRSCGAFDLKGVPGSWELYEVLARASGAA